MPRTEVRGGQVKDATLTESDLAFSDVTTLDVSTAQHGLFPKLPTPAGKFLRDDLTWQTVAGGSPPSINIQKLNPTENIVITAGYAGYISNYYQIVLTYTLEVGVGAYFEIG